MQVALPRLRNLLAATFAATLGCARAQEAMTPAMERGAARPHCFSTAQTRAEIEARRLTDPFSSMRDPMLRAHGEPLGAKLCRHGESYIYEISLLRHDGRIVKILVDAVSGRLHSGQLEK